MEGEYGEQPQREDDRPDDPIRDATLALCEAVLRLHGRPTDKFHETCGCLVCQAVALRAALGDTVIQVREVTPESLRPVYEAHDWLSPKATR